MALTKKVCRVWRLCTQDMGYRMKGTSSRQWIQRQHNDIYVKRARAENWRCRSAFKLLEIDDKYKILQPGQLVIDIGAAPGSWTQVACQRTNATDSSRPRGRVISIDLLPISKIPGADVLDCMDFTSQDCQEKIILLSEGKKPDVMLSDMAPNASGFKEFDGRLLVSLVSKVLQFSVTQLAVNGTVLVKLWQGSGCRELTTVMEELFTSVKLVKPKASRDDSREIYFLCQKFKGLETTE
ncbi:ribosomal RNA large subunit methyltransferase E-like isoform X2 [Ostrea edulis]|uniref:ribosomal RNA large subunit methyltransferase E-like isoform X2 n=1 Tax=Ostrea edulis TaxID=37623 RepID=UPI0024AF6F97|nr:ribosomal RNA large subunit methyltransferase E-like isoform X2 [Ostrea edulis]